MQNFVNEAAFENYTCNTVYSLLYIDSGMEEVDATVNSDDETDFSKMDMVRSSLLNIVSV